MLRRQVACPRPSWGGEMPDVCPSGGPVAVGKLAASVVAITLYGQIPRSGPIRTRRDVRRSRARSARWWSSWLSAGELIRGTVRRHATPRVPGPHADPRRTTSPQRRGRIRPALQRPPSAPGCAAPSPGPRLDQAGRAVLAALIRHLPRRWRAHRLALPQPACWTRASAHHGDLRVLGRVAATNARAPNCEAVQTR